MSTLDGMHGTAPKCFGANLMIQRCRPVSLFSQVKFLLMPIIIMSPSGNSWQVKIPCATRDPPGKLSARICLGPVLRVQNEAKSVLLGRKSRRNTGALESESLRATVIWGNIMETVGLQS